VRFANHYNTTSICVASRCSVLTGLYEYRHGCNFDHGSLDRRLFAETYPVLFDRTTSWATKEPLLKLTKGKGGEVACQRKHRRAHQTIA
jgi:hypothetical protein